jgi:glycosyltransferase involved in cell wall biosynthesis
MGSLKVLYISSGDLIGSRFNGFDWFEDLKKKKVSASLLVNWNQNSSGKNVSNISRFWNQILMRKLRRLIYQSYLKEGIEYGEYPWSRGVFRTKEYREADLVHLQIVHDGTLDLKTISRILSEKPVVWTWHDPWPLTGHCVYPMSCSRYKSGCGECPDLNRPFTIGKDLTIQNRTHKQEIIGQSQVIHLSTKWFEKLVRESSDPELKIKVIPFALSQEFFQPIYKQESRKKFGIPKENFVIGIRSVVEPQKNFQLFVEAIRLLGPDRNISIVTLQEFGQLREFEESFHIVELPWTNSNSELLNFYDALDVFLMPSLYETFGFMGIEAMARGVPVIGLAETALDEVCNLKDNGFIVENEPDNLRKIILLAKNNRSLTLEKSLLSKKHIALNFAMDDFIDKLITLYNETIMEFKAK